MAVFVVYPLCACPVPTLDPLCTRFVPNAGEDGTRLYVSCLAYFEDLPSALACQHSALLGACASRALCLVSHQPYLVRAVHGDSLFLGLLALCASGATCFTFAVLLVPHQPYLVCARYDGLLILPVGYYARHPTNCTWCMPCSVSHRLCHALVPFCSICWFCSRYVRLFRTCSALFAGSAIVPSHPRSMPPHYLVPHSLHAGLNGAHALALACCHLHHRPTRPCG